MPKVASLSKTNTRNQVQQFDRQEYESKIFLGWPSSETTSTLIPVSST